MLIVDYSLRDLDSFLVKKQETAINITVNKRFPWVQTDEVFYLEC